jgi:hypothetical protein
MKKNKFAIWSFLGLLLVFLLWVSINPVVLGKFDLCENPVIYSAREKAEESWKKSDYLKAMGETLRAGWVKSDCGLRLAISNPFFRRAFILEKQGQLKEAIDVCMTGAHVVGQYDLEGVFMYSCDEMNMKYDALLSGSTLPTLTPTIEP